MPSRKTFYKKVLELLLSTSQLISYHVMGFILHFTHLQGGIVVGVVELSAASATLRDLQGHRQ